MNFQFIVIMRKRVHYFVDPALGNDI